MSDLELFPERRDGGDLALFPAIERRTAPPRFLRRKPRARALLAKQPPCPTCGGVVGPLTRICGTCHFADGWWESGCTPPRYQPPAWVAEAAEARVEAARAAGEEWAQ